MNRMKIQTRVAGITFEGRAEWIERNCKLGQAVKIVPEPNNAFDHNALMVTVAHDTACIGYIPRWLAAKLAPGLPNGCSGVIVDIALDDTPPVNFTYVLEFKVKRVDIEIEVPDSLEAAFNAPGDDPVLPERI